MDGLSAAASGIAIISLTIQLVDSIRQIQEFLRDVSDAPKELARLIDLLGLLEMILQNTKDMIETQRRTTWKADVDVHPSVLKAIEACEAKLRFLVEVIERTKKGSISNGKAARSVASFKLACKKKDIERFETQLDHAITMLNTTITINLNTTYSHGMSRMMEEFALTRDHITTTCTKDIVVLHAAVQSGHNKPNVEYSTQQVATKSELPSGKTSKAVSTNQSMSTTYYSGFLGKAILRRICKSTVIDGEDVSSQTEDTWMFMPSFLSRCLELQVVSSFGKVQNSLRIRPVISQEHPIWQMCKKGNVDDPDGKTLLHTDSLPWLPYSLRATNFTPSKAFNFYTLIFSTSEEADFAYFCRGLFFPSTRYSEYTSEVFNELVVKWVNEHNVNKFYTSIISEAMTRFRDEGYCDYHEWTEIIRHLIHLGANIGKHTNEAIHSLLDEVMNFAETPFESAYIGDIWLDILSYSKVDVAQYLREEGLGPPNRCRLLTLKIWGADRKRVIVVGEGERPTITWDWFIDPEGEAFEVAQEFRYFGRREDHWFGWGWMGSEFGEFINWPYIYPLWQYYDYGSQNGYYCEEEEKYLDRFEARFKHRQQKKAMKLAKAQGIKKTRTIPGAWIDWIQRGNAQFFKDEAFSGISSRRGFGDFQIGLLEASS
ncbi:hypothetical protein EG329_008273 [Mollisiaceae sp. DMI_Dod_QoI]|nr:hypothetical protein EG329_008273 [Helotiales sp. DMI_Dod_QoI]